MTRQRPDPAAAQASGLRTAAGVGGLDRPGRGRNGRDVGGERGQLGVGPRGERPARTPPAHPFGLITRKSYEVTYC